VSRLGAACGQPHDIIAGKRVNKIDGVLKSDGRLKATHLYWQAEIDDGSEPAIVMVARRRYDERCGATAAVRIV